MVPQEIYIRNASDTEARGPFNLEQLTSLAENEQVTRETVFYNNEKVRKHAQTMDKRFKTIYGEEGSCTCIPRDKVEKRAS